jgi:hypothetical protein
VQNYLIATQIHSPQSPTTGITRVTGTYADDDIRVRGEWLIQTRTLVITSSVHIPAGL